MQNRRAIDSMKSSIDAAALQADIARRYKLPGGAPRKVVQVTSLSTGKGKSSKYLVPLLSSSTSSQIVCESCGAYNLHTEHICRTCGYYRTITYQHPVKSLAELRGLVQAPPKIEVMIDSEWDVVEAKLAGRNDAFCPICMEGFKEGREVLLSCSHMFHRHCLTSFEKFMKSDEKSCPVCRGKKYQKKITRQGSKSFQKICITKIQKIFRGFAARKRFYFFIRSYYKKGEGGSSNHKTKFYEKELKIYMMKLDADFQERKIESDSVICSVDKILNENRRLDILFDNMIRQRRIVNSQNSDTIMGYCPQDFDDNEYMDTQHAPLHRADDLNGRIMKENLSDEQWNDILTRAKRRGFEKCAICMSKNCSSYVNSSTTASFFIQNHHSSDCLIDPNNGNKECNGQRQLLILSCSHIFHFQCIQNFENFLADNQVSQERACPVCRFCDYSKKKLFFGDRNQRMCK